MSIKEKKNIIWTRDRKKYKIIDIKNVNESYQMGIVSGNKWKSRKSILAQSVGRF